MQYISVALSDICAETKQNKTSGRNGSPFDFLCRCGMRAEGWACASTWESECERETARVVCVWLFTCPVRWSCWRCVWQRACVLECGLTFNSTSDIRSPHREFTIFSHVSKKQHTMLLLISVSTPLLSMSLLYFIHQATLHTKVVICNIESTLMYLLSASLPITYLMAHYASDPNWKMMQYKYNLHLPALVKIQGKVCYKTVNLTQKTTGTDTNQTQHSRRLFWPSCSAIFLYTDQA